MITKRRNRVYQSDRLWSDTAAERPGSARANYNLGLDLEVIPGREAEALHRYEQALRINPDYAEAHNNLGLALEGAPGGLAGSIAHYEKAIRIAPDFAEAQYNLANALAKIPGAFPRRWNTTGMPARLLPEPGGIALQLRQRPGEGGRRLADATAQYEEALRINPDYAEAHTNLGNVLARRPGRLSDAVAQYEEALRLKPDFAEAHYDLQTRWREFPGARQGRRTSTGRQSG